MPEIITRTRLEIEDQLHVRQSGTTVFSVAPATGGEIVTVDTTGTPRLEITGRIVVRGDTSVIGSSSIEIETARAEVATSSGASVTAVGLIPAGVLVLGVTTRVRTPVTGPSGYDVGDGVDVDRWGNSIAVAASTPSDVTDYTSTALTYFPAAGDVVITSDGVDFTGGTIAVAVQYIRPTAPVN